MLNSRCQPIAIRDVIKYLVGVLEAENLTSRVFSIGGKDIFTYLWGNIYWYLLWKFHAKVFKQMLKFFYKVSVRPDGAEAEA